ncbi:MAG: hypothetical protein ABW182_10655 [Sphingomonas sp.]
MQNRSTFSRIRDVAGHRGTVAGLTMCATLALAGCGGSGQPAATGPQQDIPAAFDTAARTISAEGYPLASCVAIADDKAKLDCYAALGFKDKGDVARVEAMAGSADILAGKRWLVTAPSPGGADSFQGLAILTFAGIPNSGPMAFRNTRITLRCPANWGGPSNQKWSAAIDLPDDVAYDSNSKDRGTMAVTVDGKPFKATQFSRTSFDIADDQATAFRDAVVAGRNFGFTVTTIDGKTGQMAAPLPESREGLTGYFAKFCP